MRIDALATAGSAGVSPASFSVRFGLAGGTPALPG